MRYGKSLVIRELIEASELDYDDCKNFQIVCPICHEPVFKCGGYGEPRQYLSHYPTKTDPKDCELRVAAYCAADVRNMNIIARGQSLEKFLLIMRKALVIRGAEIRAEVKSQPTDSRTMWREMINGVERKYYRLFIEGCAVFLRREKFDEVWTFLIEDNKAISGTMERWRLDFGRDLFRHLVSANGLPNLFSASMIANLIWIELDHLARAGEKYKFDFEWRDIMRHLNYDNNTKLYKYLIGTANIPHAYGLDSKYEQIMRIATHNTATFLSVFPYERFVNDILVPGQICA